jgi:hypothetical protein
MLSCFFGVIFETFLEILVIFIMTKDMVIFPSFPDLPLDNQCIYS